MPIFEYDCSNCGVSFEKLIRSTAGSSATRIACPRCNSRRIRKRMSTFASHSHASTGEMPAKSSNGHSCGGSCGSCKGCGHH